MNRYYHRYPEDIRAVKYEGQESFKKLFGEGLDTYFNKYRNKYYLKPLFGPKNHPSPGEYIVWRNSHRVDFLSEIQFRTEFCTAQKFDKNSL